MDWDAKPTGTRTLAICERITHEYCLMKVNAMRKLKRGENAELDAVANYELVPKLTADQIKRLTRLKAHLDGTTFSYDMNAGEEDTT